MAGKSQEEYEQLLRAVVAACSCEPALSVVVMSDFKLVIM